MKDQKLNRIEISIDPDLMDKYFEAFDKLATDDEEPEVVEIKPVLKFRSGPEFGCLTCKLEFGRENKTAPKKCPKCKSDIIFKRWEALSDDAKEAKYSPNLEEQILGGPKKADKYFGFRQIRAAWRGK